ncbi:MAG: ATP-binding protein [Synergistaceae bacterium]|nr:ATP-binding protein [Synergistaceae bacterium]
MKKLVVEASADNLDDVLDFVNEELERHNCPSNLQNQINVAVEEIFVNIVNYAYKPAGGSVAVFVYIYAGEEAVIRFEDTGRPYNPLEHPPPDLGKPLMEREIGGLGIFLARQLMETVVYKYTDDKNVLVMTKKF